MAETPNVVEELQARFGAEKVLPQATPDGVPTIWVGADQAGEILRYLKQEAPKPYRMLFDLTALDERTREHRPGQPPGDFTVVYLLLSLHRTEYVRIKVALQGDAPSIRTITDLWPSANWYERELWDMFGIRVEGHPHLHRILMPPWWQGHPLRKDHPARATDMPPFEMTEDQYAEYERQLEFQPEHWGLAEHAGRRDLLFLNVGPQHPGTHGVLRLVLQLDDEEIVNVVPDIGYHHRGAEKMGERQSWHTYIPYTDRVDYLGGVMNNLAYLLSVEILARIEVPDRAKVIRVMLCELYRIYSHLVFYGTFGQDLGALSPVFYMFTDREHVLQIIEAVCGARMHPNWFRIGGVAQDLPQGWERLVREFLRYMPKRLREYDRMVMKNSIFRKRTKGIGIYSLEEAVDWGVTGPNLRACGLEWDFRKKTPYSGYDQFAFDIPTGTHGDCYDRAAVRVEEMRQSLRIIQQCVDQMPAGPYKSPHPLTTPPLKERTMYDIETLIDHFLNVSWGPPIPPGEAFFGIEGTKGGYGYYLVSDGGTMSYRTRIRTPSFPHIQTVPRLAKGLMISDLIAILGSIDFVMADVDR